VQNEALCNVENFMSLTDDVNTQFKDSKGATQLWKAAEQGHEKAVRALLAHPKINPNQIRLDTRTTPLYVSAYHGHEAVVRAIILHPNVLVNLGQLGTSSSPLFMAVQEGREGVVEALLGANGIDVNQKTKTGVTSLCKACDLGHEHIVKLLLGVGSIDINYKLNNGDTALSIALRQGNTNIIQMLSAHPAKSGASAEKVEGTKGECPPVKSSQSRKPMTEAWILPVDRSGISDDVHSPSKPFQVSL
jgi:ankyrin repeat protein